MAAQSGATSSLSTNWRFFPLGFACEYLFSTPLVKFQLSEVTDYILRHFIPAGLLEAPAVTDLKGRDAGRMIACDEYHHRVPARDELLYLAGELYFPNLDAAAAEPGLVTEGFEVSLRTPFKEFEGSQHIVHSVETTRHGALPDYVPLRCIGRIIPAKVTVLRFAIDVFHAKFFSSFIGFSPVVTQSLLIDADTQNFALQIAAESLPKRDTLPLKRLDYFDGVAELLRELFNFDFRADYQEKLRS